MVGFGLQLAPRIIARVRAYGMAGGSGHSLQLFAFRAMPACGFFCGLEYRAGYVRQTVDELVGLRWPQMVMRVRYEGAPLPLWEGQEYGPNDVREWGFEVAEYGTDSVKLAEPAEASCENYVASGKGARG